MLGQEGDVSHTRYSSAIDWSVNHTWSDISEPLFCRLDLDEILQSERELFTITSAAFQEWKHAIPEYSGDVAYNDPRCV